MRLQTSTLRKLVPYRKVHLNVMKKLVRPHSAPMLIDLDHSFYNCLQNTSSRRKLVPSKLVSWDQINNLQPIDLFLWCNVFKSSVCMQTYDSHTHNFFAFTSVLYFCPKYPYCGIFHVHFQVHMCGFGWSSVLDHIALFASIGRTMPSNLDINNSATFFCTFFSHLLYILGQHLSFEISYRELSLTLQIFTNGVQHLLSPDPW